MRAIAYLLGRNIKNGIVDTFRHPLKLIVYGLLAMSLVYAVIRGFTMEVDVNDTLDSRLLYGGFLALLYFISIPIMLKGISTGSTFFTMGDVNNLFTAPISPKKLLVYGIGKQLATSLFLVVCFSAYGSMALKMFALSVSSALLLVGGIALMLLMVQMMTLLIFCLCSTRPSLSSYLKYFIYFLAVYALGSVIAFMFVNGLTLENLYAAIAQPYLQYVPIIGWVHGFVFGLMRGNGTAVLLYGLLLLGCCLVSVLVFWRTKPDYYEDVLQSAENYYEFRESIRTGNMSEKVMLGDKKIHLRKTGIRKGSGASAIFFKHLREGARRSRFMFFNINTVVLLGITAVIGFAMKQFFGSTENVTVIYIANAVICAYVQFFFSAAGDWVKELNKPYIFLIPDSPVKKLIMAGATSIIKPFIDGAIAFLVLWLIVGGYPTDVLVCMLVYGSFGCIYISSNILAQRIVGISGNRGVFITFYMGIMVLLMIPGIFVGIMLLSAISADWTFIAATVLGTPVLVWNLFISLMIFLLCKNLLNNIE